MIETNGRLLALFEGNKHKFVAGKHVFIKRWSKRNKCWVVDIRPFTRQEALDKSAYNAIHKWRLRHRTKKHICEHCGKCTKTQWANISENYIKDNDDDWLELCLHCHFTFDNPGKEFPEKKKPEKKIYKSPQKFRSVVPPHKWISP